MARDKDWEIKATYVEIYNEQLRDLLLPEDASATERPPIAIREDSRGHILLTGLHQVNIESDEELLQALRFGSSIRQTDATAINAISSRSHAVFSINLVRRQKPVNKRFSMPADAENESEAITTESKMHFVDLAGSERLKNTGASGDRAREGIAINAGLASLGKVISQLSSKHAAVQHISYRDSKLTRLLQDSLGGSAVTYMIACVTPAEFHLSETLNTIQYAQRARAIQSKPQLQQMADHDDKQLLIDRLRAEIGFLRQQIKSSSLQPPQERQERLVEREAELQSHLLHVQESYNALGQRHARLLAEVAKAQPEEPASERLKRSNSFAEAAEQVVVEYEKTIQSLENSLMTTRTNLTATENDLAEKENACTHVETVNQQLKDRVRKLVDRELANEHYLHDLEAKLDGHAAGDEEGTESIQKLSKELGRTRENEARCEEYIATLEERLAASDRDAELKQHALDRLEEVVERQRSLGKLDGLVYGFDRLNDTDHRQDDRSNVRSGDQASKTNDLGGDREINLNGDSPEQTAAVYVKLETLTQELMELRIEHETTQNDHDSMAAKYEEALRALVEKQEGEKEQAFLGGTGRGHASSSRSLSSELSLAEDSNTSLEVLEDDMHGDLLQRQKREFQVQMEEKDDAMVSLKNTYAELQELHVETLEIVEELKAEVIKAKMHAPSSPSSPVIRRKSSQNMMTIDRAHRSLASLKNIAAEHFDHDPDIMQNFELNLNTAMHELHQRSERVQALEGELAVLKKDMGNKTAMISGLTRERSSIKATAPIVDMSIMSTLTDQLAQQENQMRQMQESHAEQIRQYKDRTPMTNHDQDQRHEEIDRLQAQIDELLAGTTDREDYEQVIQSLQQEVEDHKQTAASQVIKIEQLMQMQDQTRDHAEVRHTDLIQHLKDEIEERQAAVEFHKHGLKTLHDAHAKELGDLHSTIASHELAQSDMDRELEELRKENHEQTDRLERIISNLTAELEESRKSLQGKLEETQVASTSLEDRHGKLQAELQELQAALKESSEAENRRIREMDALRGEKERAANLVEELEQQLSASYDQQQVSSSRLSQLNNNRTSEQRVVSEATASILLLEKQLETSQLQVDQLQVSFQFCFLNYTHQ